MNRTSQMGEFPCANYFRINNYPLLAFQNAIELSEDPLTIILELLLKSRPGILYLCAFNF